MCPPVKLESRPRDDKRIPGEFPSFQMEFKSEPLNEQVLQHDAELFLSGARRDLCEEVKAVTVDNRLARNLEILDIPGNDNQVFQVAEV